jgi:hypothetical protein
LESQSLFFAHLTALIERSNGEFWDVIPPRDFESDLIDSLAVDSCAAFVESILPSIPDSDALIARLLGEIAGRSVNSLASLRIVRSAIECEKISAESISPHMDRILTETFANRDWRYVDFLRSLYSAAVANRHCPAWVRVADSVACCYGQVCELLSETERFCQFECAAGKLFLLIANDRGCVGEEACAVVQRSLVLLFRCPSNSFLHNFSVGGVRLLAGRGAVRKVIEEARLVEQIIANYEDGKWDGRAFWGQLRVIADLIDPYVNRRQCGKWEPVVVRSNRQRETVIDREGAKVATGSNLLAVLEFPVVGKMVIWGVALLLVLVVYGLSAI